jgi:putative endonuclease
LRAIAKQSFHLETASFLSVKQLLLHIFLRIERGGCVYIITNKNNSVLYTGVTSNLKERFYQHRTKQYTSSFTSKYNVEKLVYYKFFSTIEEAISEEKRIKAGNRNNKIKLIETINPLWEDLWEKTI